MAKIKLCRWKSKVNSKVCQPGMHPEGTEWLKKKKPRSTLLMVSFAVIMKDMTDFIRVHCRTPEGQWNTNNN